MNNCITLCISSLSSDKRKESASLIMKTNSRQDKVQGLQNCLLALDGFLTLLSVCACVPSSPFPYLQTTSAKWGEWNYISTMWQNWDHPSQEQSIINLTGESVHCMWRQRSPSHFFPLTKLTWSSWTVYKAEINTQICVRSYYHRLYTYIWKLQYL